MGSALAKARRENNEAARRPGRIRVMVIDDSITARSALLRTIDARREMQVVATAGSAEVGLELLEDRQVDVILLDLEMPGMGGLKALPEILRKSLGAKVLVVSTLTTAGAKPTLEALAIGAADTFAKPKSGGFSPEYREELLAKIVALAEDSRPFQAANATPPAVAPARVSSLKPAIIALGASTGGIHALGRFFGGLSPQITAPILVTQHLPATFMPVFARQIATMSNRPAWVAETGMQLQQGEIYIAPGHGHLTLVKNGDAVEVRIAEFSATSGCCPSVDPMLESVAELFGSRGLGIVLSGMGRDGSIGGTALRQRGGTLFAQDEDSCAVFGMPRGIVEAGLAAATDTPEKLAALIGSKPEVE